MWRRADFAGRARIFVRKFGILREGTPVPGISERAAFIVDRSGKIAFARVYPLDQLPDMDELLRVLQQLSAR